MSDTDLQALEAEAAALDATAAAVPGAVEAPAAPVVDSAAEVAALLQTVSALLSPMFPSLSTIYTEATCRKLAAAAAPVLAKYDMSVGGLFERWGPEIGLAAAALPVAVATHRGIRADLAARVAKTDDEPEAGQVD